MEESRQNLLTYSEQFDNADWLLPGCLVFGSGSTANTTTAPDGSSTADLITQDAGNSLHALSRSSAFSVESGKAYTLSVFLKSNGVDWAFLQLNGNIWSESGDRPRFWFNLSTGEEGSSDRNSGVGLTSFGNGWYRAHITATASTNANTNLSIAMSVADGNNSSYTGDGTSGIYIWGAQLEAGSFPTSYIPTTGATATRAADVASISGSNFSSWYRQDEGTVFADTASYGSRSGGNNVGIVVASDGSSSNFVGILANAAVSPNPAVQPQIYSGGAPQVVMSLADDAINTKSAMCYATNNEFAVLNNGNNSTDLSSTMPSALDRLQIGDFPGTRLLNGTIRRLTYWPQRLPNDTLQTITV